MYNFISKFQTHITITFNCRYLFFLFCGIDFFAFDDAVDFAVFGIGALDFLVEYIFQPSMVKLFSKWQQTKQ